jgi:hypothetical protein
MSWIRRKIKYEEVTSQIKDWLEAAVGRPDL